VTLVGAGLRIEHDDAAIAIAVRHVKLVRRVVGKHVRRPVEPRGVAGARSLGAVVLADLPDEFSVG
jgi:hypothetical protein